jgi:predicted dithiol-disulfide oxidoreductase (DUF899 family)
MGTYTWLHLTARGRQEDWELEPRYSDGPAMSWLHRHDEYPPEDARTERDQRRHGSMQHAV